MGIKTEEKSIRERLIEASDMGQEPKDRLWAVVIVLAVLIFALGAFQIENRLYLAEGRSLSYERTAADCLDIVIDDDRNFDFPAICRDGRVIVHFPPEVCVEFFPDDVTCATKWED